jgi:S1-C subfamily serine protease
VPREESTITGQNPLAGLMVANLSPAVADELGLPVGLEGVVATNVKDMPAARFFRKGDILVNVNGVQIDTVATLLAALNQGSDYWDIEILRGSRSLHLRLG